MSAHGPDAVPRFVLDDVGGARSTSDLVGSLLARAATLGVVTGGQALASLVAGLAALGREAATTTSDGARLREALLESRIAANGEALWARLGTGDALAAAPPSPILEDLRNDVALLLAHDLDAVLADIDMIEPSEHIGPLAEPDRADCVHLIIGLWAYASEIVAVVDALTIHAEPGAVRAPAPSLDHDGPVLR